MRVFIAVDLNDAAREAVARAAREMRGIADGRYVPREMYHVTLAFPGELDPARIVQVRAAMGEAAQRARKIPLALGRPGCFGRADGILYGGIVGAELLAPVADDLRSALAARDLPFDPKPFKAHITIARRVNATEELLAIPIPRAEFIAEGLTLYESRRVDGVLRYLPIHFAPFAGR